MEYLIKNIPIIIGSVFIVLVLLFLVSMMVARARYVKQVEALKVKVTYYHENIMGKDGKYYDRSKYLIRFYDFSTLDLIRTNTVLDRNGYDPEMLNLLEEIYKDVQVC